MDTGTLQKLRVPKKKRSEIEPPDPVAAEARMDAVLAAGVPNAGAASQPSQTAARKRGRGSTQPAAPAQEDASTQDL